MLSAKPDQEEKKYADLYSKWQKNEAMRDAGDKAIRERNTGMALQREERFQRLMHNVAQNNSLASELASMLKQQDALESRKSRELKAEWEDKVFGPLMAQASAHMNPSYRPPAKLLRQQRISGSCLDFCLPEQQPILVVRSNEDPVKREIMDDAREKAFQHAATHVITGSRSMPDLYSSFHGSPSPARTMQLGALAPAVSRVVMEPADYGHVKEHVPPPGFSGRRRGADAHIPDECDGVRAAGTKRNRVDGLHNKGVLQGSRSLGESLEHKTCAGAGNGAPMQDHYGFACGPQVTDLELPLGKRMIAGVIR